MTRPEFDQDAHEAFLAERYARLARIEAFDKLVDMALDGVITMEQAQVAWESEELTYGSEATA